MAPDSGNPDVPEPARVEDSSDSAQSQTHNDMQTPANLTSEKIRHLEEENVRLTLENMKLTKELEIYKASAFSPAALRDDNEKVKFFTGLPTFTVLMAVFSFVRKPLTAHHLEKLTIFQQFILVLMKLRLNLTNQDLGYRFAVSESTAVKIIHKWIQLMYVRLKPVIVCPEREVLRKTLPRQFRKHFGRCVVIIDCFEIFCERPRKLMARSQTYSNYKSHNTVKVLIGVTPHGTISFISRAWGGRTSDKHLTEHCGLLKLLTPGDEVLADRGFTVEESVGIHCAKLVIHPFTRGRKQLPRLEVDKGRRIARVRIHVERVIGMLRQKYTFLQSTLPISLLMHDGDTRHSQIDKIITVCAALCNCCKSVVPKN